MCFYNARYRNKATEFSIYNFGDRQNTNLEKYSYKIMKYFLEIPSIPLAKIRQILKCSYATSDDFDYIREKIQF